MEDRIKEWTENLEKWWQTNIRTGETEPKVRLTKKEKKAIVKFYFKCRSHIEHEDHLVNQRLTWLITFQGLLFTAYGVSLSGEGTSLAATGLGTAPTNTATLSVQAYHQFIDNLSAIRQSLIILGTFASIVALVGIVAAFRATQDYTRQLECFCNEVVDYSRGVAPFKVKKLMFRPYPALTGETGSTFFGMMCGLCLPLLIAGGWVFIGTHLEIAGRIQIQSNMWIFYLLLILILISSLFHIFAGPTASERKYSQVVFSISILFLVGFLGFGDILLNFIYFAVQLMLN